MTTAILAFIILLAAAVALGLGQFLGRKPVKTTCASTGGECTCSGEKKEQTCATEESEE